MQAEVAEFIRKTHYQFAHEPRGAESDSWKRALEMVVGKREVFSNQVGREAGGTELLSDGKVFDPRDPKG